MIGTFQHYVPRFVLRGFGQGKRSREKIHVYDKKTGREFITGISEIGAEHGFYDLHGMSIDDHLTDLENEAAPQLHRMVKHVSLKGIDRPLVALFVAIQEFRTDAFRSKIRRIAVNLADHTRAMGFDPAEVETIRRMNEEQVRISSVEMIASAEPMAAMLLQLSWHLFEVPPSQTLYTSDAPVVRQNMRHRGEMFSMGLVSDGIEIYFPLGERLVLGMLCPSYAERMTKTYLGSNPSTPQWEAKVRGLIEKGLVFTLQPDVITNLNSLQAFQARRFIFASRGGFLLAREMAKKEPEMNEALVADERFAKMREEIRPKPRRAVRSRGRLRTRPGMPSPHKDQFEC